MEAVAGDRQVPATARWADALWFRIGDCARVSIAEHGALLALVGAYAVAAFAVSLVTGAPLEIGWFAGPQLWSAGVVAYGAVGARVLWVGWRRLAVGGASPHDSLTRAVLADLRTTHFRVHRALDFAVVFAMLSLLGSVFSWLKPRVTQENAFAWDSALAAADRTLHAGRQPWELLQPLFGDPWVTVLLDRAYALWFPVMFTTVIWQAWSPRGPRRTRFLLSFALSWAVLGTMLAATVSSAGPCFYSQVTGEPSPFAPLSAYLNAVDASHTLLTVRVQDALWRDFLTAKGGVVSGISAMPSMHVSVSVLLALVAWNTNRIVGGIYWVFAAVILIGSVHLNWHYAVDGYVSLLLTVTVWRIVGAMVRRRGCAPTWPTSGAGPGGSTR